MKGSFIGAFVFALLLPVLVFGQQTTVMGTITDDEGEPLIGANVLIGELVIGASSDLDGNYSFQVPAQHVGETFELSARYVGYSEQARMITITAGTMTEDFQLALDLLSLDELVVTGVSEATPKKKLAFTVDRVAGEDIAIAPASNPVASIQGKVAGVSVVAWSGAPGDGMGVRLRGTTSLNESNQPLYIVDGVILGSNQVDIDALDIEDVEIVKGAAASSLYGSRAQAGVINITTRRGSTIGLNQTRVTVRNEFGFGSIRKNLVTNVSHDLRVNDSGQFVNSEGVLNTCDTCLDNGYGPGVLQQTNGNGAAFYDTPYQGTTYNAFDEFFEPGNTWTNYVGVSQNSAKTNFLASFTNVEEQGAIAGLEGLNRKSVRINMDHRVRNNFTISTSGFYSQSTNDALQSSLASDVAINPFFGLMFTTPLVSLGTRDSNGQLMVQADPLSVEENPLYTIENADLSQGRSRILGNFRTRWSPRPWVDLEGNFSYDRSDRDEREFYDIGYATIEPSGLNSGQVESRNGLTEAINVDATASFRKRFGDFTTRGILKAQLEDFDSINEFIIGNDLVTVGLSDLSNVEDKESLTIGTGTSTVRSEGYYVTGGVDYQDRYIADLLYRRDGSSLFGADERWQSYYRGSAAWRLSEETWWPAGDILTEFKLRGSRGTAGGRPRFQAQYETLSLSNGTLTKSTLGNALLKPELQTETELGIDFAVKDRIFFELVYADTKVEDLLLAVPLAGFYGFGSQWRNAGTIESNTIELSANGSVLNTSDLSVEMGIVFDRTRQEITEFNSNPYNGGALSLFFYREGETLGSMYGQLFMTETGQLPAGYDPSAFAVNDDGYLVAVGAGNNAESGPGGDGVVGTDDDLWGSTVDAGDGTMLRWGIPLKYFDEVEDTDQVEIGRTLPDFNLGFNTNVRYKGVSLYMLWGAQIGGDVYNFTKQWSYRDGRAADQDQGHKPEQLKKSTTYYEVLYDATGRNSHFVEDGTYLKLREVSLGYTFNRRQLQKYVGNALHSVSISVIGRNLLTFTDYTGFDPEVGSNPDPTLYRVDDFNYPPFRTVRGKLEIQF